MAFKRLDGKQGHCNVCLNLIRDDCRISLSTGMIHCRDTQANPADYIFRGFDKRGFGMWAHKEAAAKWKEMKAADRKAKWLGEQIRQANQKEKQKKFALSIVDRDRAIRDLIAMLPLTAEDKEEIKNKRELSDYHRKTRLSQLKTLAKLI